jgi:hypothetical protein
MKVFFCFVIEKKHAENDPFSETELRSNLGKKTVRVIDSFNTYFYLK